MRPGAGQSHVELVDAELVEQMEDLDLGLEWRIDRRGALDAVAQRLVEHDRSGELAGAARAVPVVEEIRHGG